MIARDLTIGGRDPAGSMRSTPAVDLQQALQSWQSLTDQAAAGISAHDLDSADTALEAREELRSRVEELVSDLKAQGGAPRDALEAIGHLQRSAAEAEARLVSVLKGEQFRLRRDIDGLGRPSAPATAYGRATGERVHRLDIVR